MTAPAIAPADTVLDELTVCKEAGGLGDDDGVKVEVEVDEV